jgi:hypothetical protein
MYPEDNRGNAKLTSNPILLYAQIGIAWRLHHASDAMVELYGDVVIEAIRDATYMFAGITGCVLVPNMVVWATREVSDMHLICDCRHYGRLNYVAFY